MPKVKPLGSPLMQAGAEAKAAARATVLSPEDMRYRLKQLLSAWKLDRREQLAAAINITPDRLDYIARNPEACKLHEAVAIQSMASEKGVRIFDLPEVAHE